MAMKSLYGFLLHRQLNNLLQSIAECSEHWIDKPMDSKYSLSFQYVIQRYKESMRCTITMTVRKNVLLKLQIPKASKNYLLFTLYWHNDIPLTVVSKSIV